MVGLIVAILFFFLNCVVGSAPATAFLNASFFLFWWYTITTGLLFALCLGTVVFIGALAYRDSSLIGCLLAITLGIIVGTILSVIALAKNILLILGSYLLCSSIVLNLLEPPVWNPMTLILGAFILLIGIIATKWPKSN